MSYSQISVMTIFLGMVACQASPPAATTNTELRVGIYQPNGQGGPVLPELFKPWTLTAGIHVTPLRPEDVRTGKLKTVEVLAVADAGSHTATLAFDAVERRAIQDFVRGGGGYVGICAGCTAAMAGSAGLGLLPIAPPPANGMKRGPFAVRLQMTRLTLSVLNDDRRFVNAVYEDGPIFDLKKQQKNAQFDPIGLFWEIIGTGNKKSPLTLTPAVITSAFGQGRAMGFCIHPERTPTLEGWLPSALRWAAKKNTLL